MRRGGAARFGLHRARRRRFARHRARQPFARLGDGRGKRKRRGYDYWEKGSRNFEAFKIAASFSFCLIMGYRAKPFRIGNFPDVGDMPQNRGTAGCFTPLPSCILQASRPKTACVLFFSKYSGLSLYCPFLPTLTRFNVQFLRFCCPFLRYRK